MKAFTDLEQSKKLAEILPIESADMYWSRCTIIDFGDNILKVSYSVEPCNISQFKNTSDDIPCWSLAALLKIIPYPELREQYNGNWTCRVSNANTTFLWEDDNPIDACYEMIIKLHKEGLL